MAERQSHSVQDYVDLAVEEARSVAWHAAGEVYGVKKMNAAGEAAKRAARIAASEALREAEATGLSEREAAKKAMEAASTAGARVTAEAREAASREAAAAREAAVAKVEARQGAGEMGGLVVAARKLTPSITDLAASIAKLAVAVRHLSESRRAAHKD